MEAERNRVSNEIASFGRNQFLALGPTALAYGSTVSDISIAGGFGYGSNYSGLPGYETTGQRLARWLSENLSPSGAVSGFGIAMEQVQSALGTKKGDPSKSLSSGGTNSGVPSLPEKLVGDQSDPRAKLNKGGGRHTSGPLTPENGGSGDFEKDLETLTGGYRPWRSGDKAPPGSLVGANGIFGRPENSGGGKSIDIPGN